MDYSQLNDAQLRTAIRFAERHLRSVEEDRGELVRAYRDEIGAMRRHLFDRVLRRIVTTAAPASDEQRLELSRAIDRSGKAAGEIAAIVRAASDGRTDRLEALTEIEAIALLISLEREA
jgi:hypothetical protein